MMIIILPNNGGTYDVWCMYYVCFDRLTNADLSLYSARNVGVYTDLSREPETTQAP